MTDSATNTANILEAIVNGMDDMMTEAAPKSVGRKGVKPATKGKAKAEKPVAAPKPEPVAKPEPIKVHGVAVKEGADVAVIEAATIAARGAFEAIARKDTDLLSAYLSLGEFQSNLKNFFASTKLAGQYVADQIPDSTKLDAALRSNCTWLFEATTGGNDAADILTVLGVNDISSFKSANPTVIRREYKLRKDAAAKKSALAESGVDVDDEEAIANAEKAAKDAAKEKAKADRELADKAVAWLIMDLNNMTAKKKRQEQLTAILVPCLTGTEDKRSGVLSLVIEDYLAAMAEEASEVPDSEDAE